MSLRSKLASFLMGRSPSPTGSGGGRLTDIQFGRILATVKPLTMVHESGVRFACEQTIDLIDRGIAGEIVECGVWRGGCSLAMLLTQREVFGRVVRPVHLLDSFEGLPPVTVRDGPLAKQWQQGADPANFLDNCKASLEELQTVLSAAGFRQDECRIWPGWFANTLPAVAGTLKERGIALLRVDGDWYDSTLGCLEHLMPLVAEHGVVVLDDYYAWDGSARAVHDYLSRHDLPYRIRSLHGCYGAYLIKKAFRDRFDIL